MGWRNRRVASTSMNRESSRSHAVFSMTLESKESINEVVNIRMSQLNLVDLAGSERQKDTHTEGSRLKVKLWPRILSPTEALDLCCCLQLFSALLLFQEASSINRSLMCLGQVIMALVDVSNGKNRHICYRDSKLTFLLRVGVSNCSAWLCRRMCYSMFVCSSLEFAFQELWHCMYSMFNIKGMVSLLCGKFDMNAIYYM